jgi:hypothetical protein
MTQAQAQQGLTEELVEVLARRHMLETPAGWSMADIKQFANALERELRASTAAAPSPVPAGPQRQEDAK